MKPLIKNFLIVVLVLLGIGLAFGLLSSDSFRSKEQISLSRLATDIAAGNVKKVVESGSKLEITYQDGKQATSTKELDASLSESLRNLGLTVEDLKKVEFEPRGASGVSAWLLPLSFTLLPLVLFILFFWMMFRQARGGVSQAFDFTKTRAKLFGAEGQVKEPVTFKDVAGLKEAKEELLEVVDFLKNPKKYLQIGAKIPRGVLLMGPPGTGKTLLARAVACEAGVPFFSASGSEFIEMFVGVGSSRVRDLFATAKRAGKSIIFIDELDAIGRMRGGGMTGGHEEREQTLNQILVEMDGFERESTVIVFGATNRPDVLDPALLRPGRFDRRVILDLPDVNDREETLAIHTRNMPLAPGTKLREIAERTPGFSGADLASLVNEAAIFAARRNKTQIHQQEFMESIDKVLLGPERKSHLLSKREKEITAFHEAGHALVAASLPHTDPVRKVSIISRGRAGGYTLKLPSEDRHLRTRTEFLEEVAVLLGGYTAEKLIFGDVTTGPSNDLEKASALARQLVTEYGMSEKLGPITFAGKTMPSFWQGDMEEAVPLSQEITTTIDREIAKIIEGGRIEAERILKLHRKTLDKIAKCLIEKETIEREEFEELLRKENLSPKKKVSAEESHTVKSPE